MSVLPVFCGPAMTRLSGVRATTTTCHNFNARDPYWAFL